ncbi:hypothetical protein C1752_00795 [Acaryochloris thomasi RCC1774]|uniref:Tic22 family protein n=1 Tax=Acaryochloris thomasi RCC1774 TaxID=1764569 RepID=A0A2W1K3K0_9CYAN|nr:Tic22 family protein [Acaryochloris thomasi]PZD74701.1 hypothetical protein C1752_00795 [Acaryochloris thomasi RCC1774]
MNRLMHWSLIATLAGSGVVVPSVTRNMTAIAIPEADVLKRLERVPVFTVTDPKGTPVLASLPNPQDKSKQIQVAYFFMGQTDAQALVTKLKADKPEIGKDAKVVTLSLKEAYNIQNENKDKKDQLAFQFLPTQQQLESAQAVLTKNGLDPKKFTGIPLFYAVGGKDKGLLTLQQGEEKVIPFYFSQKDLEGMLAQLKKQDAKLSESTTVSVTSLDRVVGSLFKEKGGEIEQIALIPSQESLKYVVEQNKANGGAAPGAAAPEKKEEEKK